MFKNLKKLWEWILPEETGYAIIRTPGAYEVYRKDELIARYPINDTDYSWYVWRRAYEAVQIAIAAERECP